MRGSALSAARAIAARNFDDSDDDSGNEDDDDEDDKSRLLSDDEHASYYRQLSPPKRPSFLPVIQTEDPRTPTAKARSESTVSPLPTPTSPARTLLPYDDENKKGNRVAGRASQTPEVKIPSSPQTIKHALKEEWSESPLKSPIKDMPAIKRDQRKQRRASALPVSPEKNATMSMVDQRKETPVSQSSISRELDPSRCIDDQSTPQSSAVALKSRVKSPSADEDKGKQGEEDIPSRASDQRDDRQQSVRDKSQARTALIATVDQPEQPQTVATAISTELSPASADDASQQAMPPALTSPMKDPPADKESRMQAEEDIPLRADHQRDKLETNLQEKPQARTVSTGANEHSKKEANPPMPISTDVGEGKASADYTSHHSMPPATTSPAGDPSAEKEGIKLPREENPARMDDRRDENKRSLQDKSQAEIASNSADEQPKQVKTLSTATSTELRETSLSSDVISRPPHPAPFTSLVEDPSVEREGAKIGDIETFFRTEYELNEQETILQSQHQQQETVAVLISTSATETSRYIDDQHKPQAAAVTPPSKDLPVNIAQVKPPGNDIAEISDNHCEEQETCLKVTSAAQNGPDCVGSHREKPKFPPAMISAAAREASILTNVPSAQNMATTKGLPAEVQFTDKSEVTPRKKATASAEMPEKVSPLTENASDTMRQSASETKESSPDCVHTESVQSVSGKEEAQISLALDTPDERVEGQRFPEDIGREPPMVLLSKTADHAEAKHFAPGQSMYHDKQEEVEVKRPSTYPTTRAERCHAQILPKIEAPDGTDGVEKQKLLPKTVSWSPEVSPSKGCIDIKDGTDAHKVLEEKHDFDSDESQCSTQYTEALPKSSQQNLHPPDDQIMRQNTTTASNTPAAAPAVGKDPVRLKTTEGSAASEAVDTESSTSALASRVDDDRLKQQFQGGNVTEDSGQTVPDEVLRAARSRSEMLEARVREEEERIEKQQRRMMELEREAVSRESMVAAAEAKALSEMKRLEELEARESEELEAIAAARRAKHALRLRELEEEEDRRVRSAAESKRLMTEAKLQQIQAESARTIEDAEKQRRASATRLRDIQEQNAVLQQRYEDLEKERARKEAEVSAAELRNATHNIGPSKSLYDVLEEMVNDDEQSEEEEQTEEDERTLMPEPHSVAANGLLFKLKALSNEALLSKDAAGRTPLFYACAHGHDECVELIVRRVPAAASMADANGDTPLHAAVSAGAAMCAKLVVDASDRIALAPNCLGMHAAHLAANTDCLEVLLQSGASFIVQDTQLRTPLFVACAMNRFDCATFLLELIDLEPNGHDSINASDARGDTTLHAAACNGAEACVRLLLESGVRCDVSNHHGLRPVDLAAKRGHANCRRLLAEYQLHHSTSASHFDSVLFLATIEGHRQCKAQLEQDPYRIIRRRESAEGEEEDERSSLERKVSRYSLRRGRSMKLAQWGSWIAYEDPENCGVYWYNQVSGEGQWTKPEAVHAAQMSQDYSSKWESMRTNSMRLAQVGEWIQYREKGCSEPFYYHPDTGDFSWERPSDLTSSLRTPAHDRRQSQARTKPTTPWTKHTDAESGKPFWYNSVSQVSQWDPPTGVDVDDNGDDGDMSLGGDPSMTTKHEKLEEGGRGEGASVIENVNDLGI